MRRALGMVVIIILETGLVGGFLALSNGWMSMAVNAAVWNQHILSGYSLSTVIIGIFGLAYLKIIWKLINRY